MVETIGMISVNREKPYLSGATLRFFGGTIDSGATVPAGIDSRYLIEFIRTRQESGFDPLADAIECGKELIPLVREGAARRESGRRSG